MKKENNKNKEPEKKLERKEKILEELSFVEKINDFGKIKLTDSVIVAVIKKAACKISGVTRLSGSSIVDNIASMISSQRIYDRAISLRIKQDTTLDIEIKINVKYGENIPNVASKVQNTIRDEIKSILGLKVAKVNIIIQEIEHAEKPKQEEGSEK